MCSCLRLATAKAIVHDIEGFRPCMAAASFIMFLISLSSACTPHDHVVSSPRVTLYIPTEPHVQSVGRCVWLRMLGCEDGWGRKHKLQAGLLLLALCPTSKRLFLSTAKHTTTGWLDPSSLLITRHGSIHPTAYKY